MSQSEGLIQSVGLAEERSDEERKQQAPRRRHHHHHQHRHSQRPQPLASSVGLSQSIDPSTTHPAAAVTSSSSSILSSTSTASSQHAQHHQHHTASLSPSEPSVDGVVFSAATWDRLKWLAGLLGASLAMLLANPIMQGFKYGVGYHLATLVSTRTGILAPQAQRISAKNRQPSVQIIYAVDGKPVGTDSFLTPRISHTQPSQRAIDLHELQPAPTQSLLGGGSRTAPADPYRHTGQPFRIHLQPEPKIEPPVRIYN